SGRFSIAPSSASIIDAPCPPFRPPRRRRFAVNRSRHAADHFSRRAFLKAAIATAGGGAVANWGGLFHSHSIGAGAKKRGRRCILLWRAGGPSHLDTFDMKPGRPVAGPFRPVATNVTGTQICEYLPRMAKRMNQVAVIRSMSTADPDHSGGTYLMHTGYKREANVH